ncbi:alpha-L-fucosidase [Colwelliaceae bacterium BS250]
MINLKNYHTSMFTLFFIVTSFLVSLLASNTVIAKEKYNTSHESLSSYDVPQWYSEGKLGVFMHLSVFSVPAFKNEWYATNMYYTPDNPHMQKHPEYTKSFSEHHIKTYGDRKEFGYKDFIPKLTLEKFDANYYADLIKKSGASYFAAPAVHHDGFAMWDSKEIEWNAAKMGPKRDVVGELTEAMRKKGIKTGVSTHYGRHWKYYNFREQFDTWDPENEGLYGKRRKDTDPPRPEDALQWERVMNELIDNYQPDYIFVDGGIADAHTEYKTEIFRDAFSRVVASYYNKGEEWNKDVAISWKRDALKAGEAIYDSEGSLAGGIKKRPWQAHYTVNGSWGYTGERPAWPTDRLVRGFVDIVSRNGNLLLNIAPRPDGTLDKGQETVLLEIGEWMQVNGEGIVKSTPWLTYGTGKLDSLQAGKPFGFDKSSIRYTQKDGALYGWFVDWPENGQIKLLKAGQFNTQKVELLGSTGSLEFSQQGDDLVVKLPKNQSGKFVWGLKLTK